MGYSNNSIKNLAILSSFVATVIFLCSLQPLTHRPLLFPLKRPKSPLMQKDELEIALENASMANKTVIIAIINKAYVESRENEYPTMFDLFLEGFWAGEGTRPLVGHLLVVSMDKTAHERCVFRRLNCYTLAAEDGGGDDRFAGEKLYMSEDFIEMMWRRTRFLLDVLKRGYNFIFTDADILWLRNPFTRLSNNATLDLQMSTDIYNGNPYSERNLINTGFYFIRSNNKTISLFEIWYGLRKNSTGLKEQDVLGNLIHQGIIEEIGLNVRFLDTFYFSGFCKDSKDVSLVVTVHANCCRSIKAKVMDLKVALRDWRRFNNDKDIALSELSRNGTRINFHWSKHTFCINSWRRNSMT